MILGLMQSAPEHVKWDNQPTNFDKETFSSAQLSRHLY